MSTQQQTPSDILRYYARTLELAAPKEWADFVQVFDAYAADVTLAVTNAASDEVLVAQGKARAFLHLLKLFRETAQPSRAPQPPIPPQP